MTEEYDHNQFRIPNMETTNTNHPSRGGLDNSTENISRPVSYEKVSEPYAIIKMIEDKIHDSRETVIAQQRLNSSRNRGWLHYLGILPTSDVGVHDLVEQESHLGGALFGEGHRFWLDAKHEGDVNAAADWYHSQPNPMNPKEEITLRFQTTPTGIHKLYNGLERPLTIQDLENFIRALPAYVQVIGDMYPVDATLAELQEEIAATRREDFRLAA